MRKPRPRVRLYDVIRRAVADGVTEGLRRAHKHNSAPSTVDVCADVEQSVMEELCEVLNLDP